MPRPLPLGLLAAVLLAQQVDFRSVIRDAGTYKVAVADFHGDSATQPLMAIFNQTLWDDLDNSGVVDLVAKTNYPARVPQQPSEFQPAGRGAAAGLAMQDWALPPTGATHLAGGYSGVQANSLVVRGWLVDVRAPGSAPAIEKSYGESLNAAGARKAAHRFAADILALFGVPSIFDTHIYYVHDTQPAPDRLTEIWAMDADGANPRRITRAREVVSEPAISPDGSKLAMVRVYPWPAMLVYGVNPVHALLFANPANLSTIAAPSFTPQGRLVYAQSVGRGKQLMIADIDGRNARALTKPGNLDTEPRVNPTNPSQLAFVTGRSGHQQLYVMNIDGSGVRRITDGTAEASNPSWSPNGRVLAYASTHKVGGGNWNIYIVDLASGAVTDLTHDNGRNEHPVWAPDGIHIVFDSDRGGTRQIWSMVADGTHVRQLTRQGVNATPVWGK